MPENKTQPTTVAVEDFLSTVPDAQKRADAAVVVELMQKATRLPPTMWGSSIIGFGHAHYIYETGREGDWFFIGLSPRKASLTLYAIDGWERYPDLLAGLGKHTLGKGCLYIKRLSDVDLPTFKKLIQTAAKHAKESAKQVHRSS